ncbi:MAG TPA: hypothetical protein VF223_21630 [Trebonia sp.]
MLALFGKDSGPIRFIAGVALLVIGIVLHMVLLAVAGGFVLAWGALRLFAARRSR